MVTSDFNAGTNMHTYLPLCQERFVFDYLKDRGRPTGYGTDFLKNLRSPKETSFRAFYQVGKR